MIRPVSFAGGMLAATGRWFDQHLLTVVVVLALAAVFCLPQLHHGFVQLPVSGADDATEVWQLRLYVVGLVVWFGLLGAVSMPRILRRLGQVPAPVHGERPEPPVVLTPEGSEPGARTGPAWLCSFWRAAHVFAAAATLGAAALRPASRAWVGAGLVVAAIVWWWSDALGAESRFVLEHASRAALAVILALAGIWLATFEHARGAGENVPLRTVVLGRVLWLMLVTYVVGELLWFLAHGHHFGASPRAYTLWALLQCAFLAVLVARAVDLLHTYSRVDVRLVCAVAVGALVAWFGPEQVGHQARDAATVPAVEQAWFDAVDARLRRIPDGPVVLVAASGGGSRAALFAALVYERLASLPVTEGSPHTFRDLVLLESSVSGGSLASAYDVHTRPDLAEPLLPAPRNSFAGELVVRMRTAAAALLGRQPNREDAMARALASLEAELGQLAQRRDPASAPADLAAVLRGRFADDMLTDFMAPMLRGVLLPGVERGTRLADFWRERFGWGDVTTATPPRPDRPLLVLNATDNARGTRLAVGFPPLPRGLLGDTASALDDLAPGWQVDLAQAVRLSANFPWGLQVAELAPGVVAPEPMAWVPPRDGTRHPWIVGDRRRVQVLDGGIVDNSGLDTLAVLFSRLRRAADAAGASGDLAGTMRTRAAALLGELCRRKVLLVEIDAGRKFQTKSWLGGAAPTVMAPFASLQAAAYVKEWLRKREHVQTISAALRGGPGALALATVPFVCNRDQDVMTAWALGSQDKAGVMAEFVVESRLQTPVLLSTYEQLRGAAGDGLRAMQAGIDAEAEQRRLRYDPKLVEQAVRPQLPRLERAPSKAEWRQQAK